MSPMGFSAVLSDACMGSYGVDASCVYRVVRWRGLLFTAFPVWFVLSGQTCKVRIV